jgi:hypothetical protein
MTRRTKKVIIALAGVGLAVLLFVPLPLVINVRDREAAVSHAITAVTRDQRVLMEKGFDSGKGYRHLDEISLAQGTQLYFSNDLGISDAVFLRHGLKPVPKDRKIRVGDGVVVISFSSRDIQGNPAKTVQFAYVFGFLGAHGYEIKIYKCLATRYFVYAHAWIS